MAKQRYLPGDPQLRKIPVQDDLARRRAEKVFASQYYIDVHHGVIDWISKGIQRVAVRADNHIIGH